MKRLLCLVLAMLLCCLPAFASMWYILVPEAGVPEVMTRLDTVKGPSPHTTHYTLPIDSRFATVTENLLPIDERAESVLTSEEWNSRVATLPVEFTRELMP